MGSLTLDIGRTIHRVTALEYLTLDTERRTELIDGLVYDVPPRNEPHRYAVRELNRLLVPGLDSDTVVQVQDDVAVPDWRGQDAPEIDVAVISHKFYRPGATAADVRVFIEVSDTTYRGDRGYKIPLYVRAGVPAWIVNIPLRQAEFYGSLDDLELEHGHVFTERDTINILGIAIPVARLVGDSTDS